MSAWSTVGSWLRRGGAVRGTAPSFRPTLEELESRAAPGALLGGVGQSPLSLLGSPSPTPSKPAAAAVVTTVTRSTATTAALTPRPFNPPAVAASTPVRAGATGQAAPPLTAPLAADPLTPALDDLTDSGSPTPVAAPAAQPTAGGGTSGGAAAPLTASRETQASAQPAASVPANIDASRGATITPPTTRPNSGYVGSQPLLDLVYGLRYGTPVEIGPGAIAPSRGTAGPSDFPFLQFDVQGRVLVNVHSTDAADLPLLERNLESQYNFTSVGVTIAQNMVSGWLPVNQILNLPNLANFDSVTPAYKPFTRVGSVTTEGDVVIKANTFRASQGVDGTGVKVGVISDSVNEFNGGLAASVATGDLPPNVQVLADDPNGNGTDEGRAMLEIVHDVAPGSPLAFDAAGNTPQNMANAITALAGVGSKVINDDIGFFDEPFYNDGVITQAAESVVSQGDVYASAAGNNSNHGYEAAWKGVNATVGGVKGQFQDITGSGSPLQTFSLGVGATTTISFEWDSAFLEGGGTGNFTVPNDLQVLITDANGNALSTPQVFNSQGTNTNEALQIVQFTNNGSFNTNNFAFAFNLVSGPAPNQIGWVSQDDGDPTADPHALKEGAPTLYGHPNGAGVLGVGAADVHTPTVPESFTALGRMPILFDANGVRLAAPLIRQQPEVTGPDDVHTSFFANPDGMGGFTFSGTSAATPHVAGAAALLFQDAPTATGAQVAQYLEQNALDINTPGFDDLTGNGLIQLTTALVVPSPSPPGPGGGGNETEPEPNQTSDVATNFGTLPAGQTENTGESIGVLPDARNDYDWYRWTAAQAGTFTATETTTTGGNLELHLFALQGDTLVELARGTAQGTAAQTLTAAVAADEVILAEVKGENNAFFHMGAGLYTLSVELT